jgi:hypothetical protein
LIDTKVYFLYIVHEEIVFIGRYPSIDLELYFNLDLRYRDLI